MRFSTAKFFCTLLPAMAVLLFSVSCRTGKVIPRSTMAEIYADMFVLDQWISSHPEYNRKADTTLVYEPVFRKYGYTPEDYQSSRTYYMSDPDRYARILRESAEMIEVHIKDLEKEKEKLDALNRLYEEADKFAPERIYYLCGLHSKDRLMSDSTVFYVDSVCAGYDFDVQHGLDTVFRGPVIEVASADTLAAVDSLVVADTVRTGGGPDILSGKNVRSGNDLSGLEKSQQNSVTGTSKVNPGLVKVDTDLKLKN